MQWFQARLCGAAAGVGAAGRLGGEGAGFAAARGSLGREVRLVGGLGAARANAFAAAGGGARGARGVWQARWGGTAAAAGAAGRHGDSGMRFRFARTGSRRRLRLFGGVWDA